VTAPAGAEVGIYVDLVERVELGHVIQTQSGRRYLVVAVRVQLRGVHAGRQHLRCVVLDASAQIGSATVHEIRWYKRRRGERAQP
jgi:hypothetical protein